MLLVDCAAVKNNQAVPKSGVDQSTSVSWALRAFKAIDSDNRGHILKHEILNHFSANGLMDHDLLLPIISSLQKMSDEAPISLPQFSELGRVSDLFFKAIFESRLIVPQFSIFVRAFKDMFDQVRTDAVKNYSWGHVATYIPSLARAKRHWFATAFCSSDGQFTQFGDVDRKFSLQSVSKVVSFAMLYEIYHQRGNVDELFKYVGVEPSGTYFNAPVFDKHNRPHNPMVNAGAMMISTLLVNEGKTIEDLMDFYMRSSSSSRADIDLPLYKEEALTGSTNHALRSLMLSRGMYPVKPTFEQTKQVLPHLYVRKCLLTLFSAR
jgi:glutaminase